LALYQPQPPQPFIGGNQPLAPREFTPPSGAVVVEKPPRRILPETVLAAWRVDPWPQQQYRKLVQEAIAAAVQPPRRTLPETILAAWRPDSKTPIISGWQVQEYVPDNPPFGLEGWLRSTLEQWRVTPWPQQRSAKLIQEAVAAAAANPSFDQSWVWGVLNQWQAVAPVTQARKLSPGIPGQSVDPPPNRAAELRAALISWQPPTPAQTFYAKFTQGIDNPPFGLPQRWRWDAPLTPAQVQYARLVQEFVTPPSADNPPFGMPPEWLWGTLGQWQTTPPRQVQYKRLIQEFVQAGADNPPFGLLRPWNTLAQWQARALTPLVQALLVQGFVPSDNPPFGMPPDWLWHTLTQWQAVTRIVQAGKLSPGIPGQSVDQPPTRSTVNFITQVKAWEPIILLPERPLYLAQPFVFIPVDNPPFGMPPDWLYTVLTAAWKPGDPLPKVLQKILQEGPPPPPDVTFRKIITLREDRIDVILG